MNSSISVLLVGGSEGDAEELFHVLEKGPFVPAIHRVTSRNAFRKSLAEGDWDAVVADFDHPPFSGVPVFQTYQEVGKDVPFILISTTADASTAAELVADGVHDCIERSRLDRLVPALVRELKAARMRHDHRQVERALRESEARFRAVIDNSPAAIVVKDTKGRLLLVNKQWERQHGLSAEKAEGKTLLDLFRRETAVILNDHDEEVLATGRPAEFEYESVGVDGLPQTDMVVKFPILGPDGSVAAIGASHTNITERKRAEEALRWSEWDLRGILDNMVDTFFRTDRDGRIIMMSPSVADLTGFSPEAMLGRHFAEFFADPGTPTDLMSLLDRNGGKLDGYEVMLRHRDGTELWALTTARRYFDEDGDIAGIEGVAHDITVRKRAEQALRDSEDRFRDFAEASSDWMWETSPDNHYTFVSDRFLDLLGKPREEIIGQSPFTIGDPIIHPADLAAHKEVFAGRHPFRDFQYSIKDSVGGLHVIRVSGKPRFGPDGAFLGYRGTANDITAIVTAEERETLIRRQFLDAIETVPVSFALFDAEDRLVLWNQLYQSQILPEIKLKPGLRFEDMVRQTAANGRIDGTGEQREAWIQDRLDRHRDPAGPFTLQRTTDWLQIREHRTPDSSTLLVAVDITDLRRTEEALRDAQASLESVLSAAPVVLWAMDAEGRFTLSRGMGLGTPGGRPDDVVGRSVTDVYGKYPEIVDAANRASHGATVHATASVAGRYFALRFQPMLGNNGEYRGCVGVAIDITERRQAEENLRKLSLAVEQSPAAILITDLDGIIEYANPRFYETTGFTPAETLGKTPAFLKSEDTDAEQFDHMWTTIMSGREWHGELRNRRKNGELFWSSTAICPIINTSGDITNFLSVAEDTTDKRRMEEQLRHAQKLEAVGTLAGGVAHDFNNILTGILGHCQIAIEKLDPDADVQFNLDQIMVASDRAKDLVQQLLAFSRRREANLRPVSLNAIVDEAVKLVHASIPSTIAIQWHVAENAVTVMADPTQIHQVLLNLCSNAADAIGETSGAITIGVESITTTAPIGVAGHDLAPGQYACLRVGDTGSGMDTYTLARAFDPFFTTKPVGAGTGLGLAAVHGIVQDHGGGIEVVSEPGKGTSFSIYLPCARVETTKDVKKIRTEFGGTERILLVDDERMVLQSIGTYLEHFGYKVEALTSPAAALAVFQSMADQFDIVVTDQVMPNMTGDVLARKLRELRPDIPIILCTGYAPPASAMARKAVGINEVVRKPIEPSELGQIIRRTLDAKS
ncbi:MAG: PAS domain S-box protein [Rhodospirillales bacterium]|nr:PAS domain S-box protein [Rhodospirillales bacterium]